MAKLPFTEFEEEEKQRLLAEIAALENELAMEDAMMDETFEWVLEFPEMLDEDLNWKGFDVVVGNPPYMILTKNNTKSKLLAKYLTDFESIKNAQSKNIFTLFIENAISLIQKKGHLSFIVPEGLFQTRSYKECVGIMNKNGSVSSITTFKDFVFENAVTGNLIFVFRNNNFEKDINYFHHSHKEYNQIENKPDKIVEKINSKNYKHLKEYAELFKGMVVKDRTEMISNECSETNKEVFLLGNSISKFTIKKKYFTNYNLLNIIGGTKLKRKYEKLPRILIRRTGDHLCCAWLDYFAYTESTLYSCYSISDMDTKYIFALLNSKLLTYYVRQCFITNKQAFPQILMSDLEEIPIVNCDHASQKNISKITDKIILLKEKDPLANILNLEQEINTIVYKLYDLSKDEIETIENAVKNG